MRSPSPGETQSERTVKLALALATLLLIAVLVVSCVAALDQAARECEYPSDEIHC